MESGLSHKWVLLLCIGSFCTGLIFTNSVVWHIIHPDQAVPGDNQIIDPRFDSGCMPSMNQISDSIKAQSARSNSHTSDHERGIESSSDNIIGYGGGSSDNIDHAHLIDSDGSQSGATNQSRNADSLDLKASGSPSSKVFMVVGINTAFSSRKRRDSIRQTWMPKGENLKKLEEEKGIIVRFVIGHGSTTGGILDRAVEAEDLQHHDFMRLAHTEGYNELSGKTKLFFTTAVSMWPDAEYYVKVDDDVHVNIGALASTLGQHRAKPRVYIGCMKSGPVLAMKGVRYHEPEHWKFGEYGNQYFRHATGQVYALSRELALYIAKHKDILHKYANEDVSVGAWFLGLNVEQIHERRMCCGTPPDCEWRRQAGNACAASYDWACSGVCNSAERLRDVHRRCDEGQRALWDSTF